MQLGTSVSTFWKKKKNPDASIIKEDDLITPVSLKIHTVRSSKLLLKFYQSTRRHKPEYRIDDRFRENVKSSSVGVLVVATAAVAVVFTHKIFEKNMNRLKLLFSTNFLQYL